MADIGENIEQLRKHGYEYIKIIGSGSYSNVFLCKSLKYNDYFAIKCVSHNKVKEYEYNALINLSHTHIIQLYEIFDEFESQYLVMDYCPNETIKQKGKLDYDQFVMYSKQILEALMFCHSKLIAHRDIKPDNILLDKYNRVKLADFGFAKQFNDVKTSDERVGSMKYCSPEIIRGQSTFDPFKADIYALGITFFYMITGQHPYTAFSVEDMKRLIVYGHIDFSEYDVDPEIQCMITKMTSHNPKLRPTASSLLNLDIYQKVPTSKSFMQPKNMDVNVCPILSNKSFICKPVTLSFSDTILSKEQRMRRNNLKRKNMLTCSLGIKCQSVIRNNTKL